MHNDKHESPHNTSCRQKHADSRWPNKHHQQTPTQGDIAMLAPSSLFDKCQASAMPLGAQTNHTRFQMRTHGVTKVDFTLGLKNKPAIWIYRIIARTFMKAEITCAAPAPTPWCPDASVKIETPRQP